MNSHSFYQDDIELTPSSTNDLETETETNYYDHDEDLRSHLLSGKALHGDGRPVTANIYSIIPSTVRRWYRRPKKGLSRTISCLPRSWLRKFVIISYSFFTIVIVAIFIGAIFFPSYTSLPPHYKSLQSQIRSSNELGRGNLENQKIFLAASIYDQDGRLANGAWGRNMLELIELLGPDNCFLSIYENDSGVEGMEALAEFETRVPCNHSLVYDPQLNLDDIPHVILPDGTERIKRIAYLAEVRNRALQPLDTSKIKYDKLLYINDVVFDPEDVLQLIFSTNADEHGQARYRAACAVDFINPFKFYDTFATRDYAGYSMGVPFFPWFAAGGDETSLQDVLKGKDAVRVRSCWGGIVSFDAQFFQNSPHTGIEQETAGNHSPGNLTAPYRFRAEEDLYWDASECCLIHADIQSTDLEQSGIYMNPFVRVAYDTTTLSWLRFTRRFERLYTPIHFMIDILAGMPRQNLRRGEKAWQEVEETVWVGNETNPQAGSFQTVKRLASHSGFCGRKSLQVLKSHPAPGEKYYEILPLPS